MRKKEIDKLKIRKKGSRPKQSVKTLFLTYIDFILNNLQPVLHTESIAFFSCTHHE